MDHRFARFVDLDIWEGKLWRAPRMSLCRALWITLLLLTVGQMDLTDAQNVSSSDSGSSCKGNTSTISDGRCDQSNNNAACDFDGGDCCVCTCVADTFACDSDSFDCLDPDAGELVYNCGASPKALASCSRDSQTSWVVEDVEGASDLAAALNCSGGTYDVEWRANISMEETIYVMNGTLLRLIGVSGSSRMYGGRINGPFVVVSNATLYMSNMVVANGSAAAGGAIAATNSVLSFDDMTFTANTAKFGGAIFAIEGSDVSINSNSKFHHNEAQYDGGALFISAGSNVKWEGDVVFRDNAASSNGGAAFVDEKSSLQGGYRESYDEARDDSTTTEFDTTTYFVNNRAVVRGGAIAAYHESIIFWTGDTIFTGNEAGDYGGAVSVSTHSNVSWSGTTTFEGNVVNVSGGAVSVFNYSDITWDAETRFENNSAGSDDGYGGAVCVHSNSRLRWSAQTTFVHNQAGFAGGGLSVTTMSVGSWSGNASFVNNTADFQGGGVFVEMAAVSWSSSTIYHLNSAAQSGGGLYVMNSSNASWTAATEFFGNSAEDTGGALTIRYDCEVFWSGPTHFANNSVQSAGGAIGTSVMESDEITARCAILALTVFDSNSAGTNGGGMSLLGALQLTSDPGTLVFRRNTAGTSGGGIIVSGTGVGPVFKGAVFDSNSAGSGGAVFATASGTQFSDGEQSTGPLTNPTTFDNCTFSNNDASGMGGAIDSAAGRDTLINSLFVGNVAGGGGGAVRVAGTTNITGCAFVENVSKGDAAGGPAVSNIGYMSDNAENSFTSNTFSCPSGYFSGIIEDERYKIVCDGCSSCDTCTVAYENAAPECLEAMDHTSSTGGNVTFETLRIDAGYWRSTNSSKDILACYNTDACLGGITGRDGFCDEGYEGPYCSVCQEGYAQSRVFTCTECSDDRGTVIRVVLIISGMLVLIAMVACVCHLVSVERDRDGPGIFSRVLRRLPIQSLKIVIVSWQIISQFAAVANVTYPNVYEQFVDVVDVFNFDIGWMLSAGCVWRFDFHDCLLMATSGPIIAMVFLWTTYQIAVRRNRTCEKALQRVRHKHMSAALLVTFLVYSTVSAAIIQVFSCDKLDDGKTYLRADYTIECRSDAHRVMSIYATMMIVVYPVGIPASYAYLLLRNRAVLTNEVTRERNAQVQAMSSLWAPYRPARYYYEVVECIRRILLTGAVVLLSSSSMTQIATVLVLAFAFVLLSEILCPFISRWDAWVSRAGHVLVFMSMYIALLMEADATEEDDDHEDVLGGILVFAQVSLILAVIAEGIGTTCAYGEETESSRREKDGVLSFVDEAEEGSQPRRRLTRGLGCRWG